MRESKLSCAGTRSEQTRRCASPRPSSTKASRSLMGRLRSETERSEISHDQLRAMQLAKLRAGLPDVLATNAFWRARLHDVRGWDDFARLPLTTKSELVADQAAAPPFGTNLTYPVDRYVRLHQTSGSSGGHPLRWLDTVGSWDWCARIWAEHVYRAAGVTGADRVFCAFSFGPFLGFWSAFSGAERLGSLCISGGAMTSEQRVHTILDLGATVLLSTPTYALRLAEVARDVGVDLARSGVRVTIHAGEPGASIPSTRDAIEAAWSAVSFDHTGMTELGPTGHSCSARDGVHLIESEYIFEVTSEGELVATNLGRWGMPLIRYRTGDRVVASREPCSCGSPFLKVVGGIRGRVDDMFTVRGVNLYPSQVEEIVRRYREVGEFVIEHRRERRVGEVAGGGETATAGFPVARVGTGLRHAVGGRLWV